MDAPVQVGPSQFACISCGAALKHAPGTDSLKCPYCGAVQDVPDTGAVIQERSYGAHVALPRKEVSRVAPHVLSCGNCGASTETKALSGPCPFCAAPMVVADTLEDLVTPEAVVPFKVDRRGAGDHFLSWSRSRWFAPTALKKVNSTEKMHGMYLPHWTFDDHTTTRYTGQRGEYYYVTVSYTDYVDGKPVQRTRQERRTRWYGASGTVSRFFDDVLTPATTHLERKRLDALGPWQLGEAVPFQPEYLSGYETQRYEVDPPDGFADAYQQMVPVIQQDIRYDIGGDEQRITSMDTRHDDVAFKLVLLPLWLATYVYGGKTYQVFVNANTGEVTGERPYSPVKIFFAVLAATLLVLGAYFGYQYSQASSGEVPYSPPSYDEPYAPPVYEDPTLEAPLGPDGLPLEQVPVGPDGLPLEQVPVGPDGLPLPAAPSG